MTTKKKPTTPQGPAPLGLTARALEHGLNAAGARFIQKGFAHTPEGDLRFALGYPHFVELIERDPRDADPAQSTAELWRELLLGHIGPEGDIDRHSWPRAVASNTARILAHPGATFYNPGSQVWGPTPKGKKLLDHGPVDRKEAGALLRMVFGTPRLRVAAAQRGQGRGFCCSARAARSVRSSIRH